MKKGYQEPDVESIDGYRAPSTSLGTEGTNTHQYSVNFNAVTIHAELDKIAEKLPETGISQQLSDDTKITITKQNFPSLFYLLWTSNCYTDLAATDKLRDIIGRINKNDTSAYKYKNNPYIIHCQTMNRLENYKSFIAKKATDVINYIRSTMDSQEGIENIIAQMFRAIDISIISKEEILQEFESSKDYKEIVESEFKQKSRLILGVLPSQDLTFDQIVSNWETPQEIAQREKREAEKAKIDAENKEKRRKLVEEERLKREEARRRKLEEKEEREENEAKIATLMSLQERQGIYCYLSKKKPELARKMNNLLQEVKKEILLSKTISRKIFEDLAAITGNACAEFKLRHERLNIEIPKSFFDIIDILAQERREELQREEKRRKKQIEDELINARTSMLNEAKTTIGSVIDQGIAEWKEELRKFQKKVEEEKKRLKQDLELEMQQKAKKEEQERLQWEAKKKLLFRGGTFAGSAVLLAAAAGLISQCQEKNTEANAVMDISHNYLQELICTPINLLPAAASIAWNALPSWNMTISDNIKNIAKNDVFRIERSLVALMDGHIANHAEFEKHFSVKDVQEAIKKDIRIVGKLLGPLMKGKITFSQFYNYCYIDKTDYVRIATNKDSVVIAELFILFAGNLINKEQLEQFCLPTNLPENISRSEREAAHIKFVNNATKNNPHLVENILIALIEGKMDSQKLPLYCSLTSLQEGARDNKDIAINLVFVFMKGRITPKQFDEYIALTSRDNLMDIMEEAHMKQIINEKEYQQATKALKVKKVKSKGRSR